MNLDSFKLDWRSTEELISTQEAVINSFLEQNTPSSFTPTDEALLILSNPVAQQDQLKVKVFCQDQNFALSFGGQTLEDFLLAVASVDSLLSLDEGSVLLIYI